jgi:hypothetical protein
VFDDEAQAADFIYDHDVTTPEWALGYRFDIVVRPAPDAI